MRGNSGINRVRLRRNSANVCHGIGRYRIGKLYSTGDKIGVRTVIDEIPTEDGGRIYKVQCLCGTVSICVRRIQGSRCAFCKTGDTLAEYQCGHTQYYNRRPVPENCSACGRPRITDAYRKALAGHKGSRTELNTTWDIAEILRKWITDKKLRLPITQEQLANNLMRESGIRADPVYAYQAIRIVCDEGLLPEPRYVRTQAA